LGLKVSVIGSKIILDILYNAFQYHLIFGKAQNSEEEKNLLLICKHICGTVLVIAISIWHLEQQQ